MARVRTLARHRAGVLVAATAALTVALTGPATATPATATTPASSDSSDPGDPDPSDPDVGIPDAGALEAGTLDATSVKAFTPALAAQLPRGHDVSSYQGRVDWTAARQKGARFVYVKATESTSYRNPRFSQQYDGARKAGLIRGAYHFALPDRASGTRQAAYFVRHGGGWRADGWTLPPVLDIEYNPYSEKHKCYGLSAQRMVRWIRSFSDEIKHETGRRPVIYTTTQWWKLCTGNSRSFSSSHPLWVARHGTARPGTLPGGWRYWTFWQYSIKGGLPGDQDLFNGSPSRLRTFARDR
ncbi:lysozyme [Streptomyces sp. NPDC040750]|uniref:lysozyme n=1 Tax=Streptomyces sp. NPDC040750 TaxID=3154491 RepID=UPI0033C42370